MTVRAGPEPVDPPDFSDDLGDVDVADLTDGDEVEDAVVTGEFAGASFDGLTVPAAGSTACG